MKTTYLALGSITLLTGCSGFMEALGSAFAETPNVGEVAGQAVTAAVDSATGGGGVLGAVFAGGSVLATTIAGIVLRTVRNMKKEPSRAEARVAVLESRLNNVTFVTETRRSTD